jgi:hypothetical protein
MTDFQVRSDNVDVEQIMRQIRSRIREKRGVDYTEDEIRELARVKLETFLDPTGVRSDLLQQFRKMRSQQEPPPNYKFEDSTIYETHRGFVRWLRKILNPILKLFFNPQPISEALHLQARVNEHHARREALDALNYELIHNLVLETTRLGIEVKNLKMRVESMSSRLDFDERRARALEGVVQYRPGVVPPLQPPPGRERDRDRDSDAAQQERRTRRRRRRGRRPGGPREGAENGAAGEAGEPREERGAEALRPDQDRSGEGGPEPVEGPKPDQDRTGVGEPVPPKPFEQRSGEGG